ncbi:MAG: hypothetical protein J6M43_06310 [Neisseriaceae bacterium]|nr:hypothetical protein [Neisseriaceae bacterium]
MGLNFNAWATSCPPYACCRCIDLRHPNKLLNAIYSEIASPMARNDGIIFRLPEKLYYLIINAIT